MRPLPQQRTERMRSSVHPSVRQRDNKTTTTPLWTKRRTISSISSTTSFSARPLPHRRRQSRTPRLQPSLSSTCNSINKNKAATDSCVSQKLYVFLCVPLSKIYYQITLYSTAFYCSTSRRERFSSRIHPASSPSRPTSFLRTTSPPLASLPTARYNSLPCLLNASLGL